MLHRLIDVSEHHGWGSGGVLGEWEENGDELNLLLLVAACSEAGQHTAASARKAAER